MDELAQRARHAAERILEDERLTDNLTDDAAQVLIDWGIACAESIARTTDDPQAMQDQLQAVRRLMRYVNKWVPRRLETDPETNQELLTKILEQVAIAYGKPASATPDLRDAFIAEFTNPTTPDAQAIETLHVFIEDLYRDPVGNSEERYGQEIYF